MAPTVAPTATTMQAPPAVTPTTTPRHVRQICEVDRGARRNRRDRCRLSSAGYSRNNQTSKDNRKYCPHASLPFYQDTRWSQGQRSIIMQPGLEKCSSAAPRDVLGQWSRKATSAFMNTRAPVCHRILERTSVIPQLAFPMLFQKPCLSSSDFVALAIPFGVKGARNGAR